MTIKSIIAVSVLALSTLGIASAEDQFTLAKPATLGTRTLKQGTYTVSMKKDQAVFTNPDGKTFTTPVRIEKADKKFSGTLVTVNGGGVLTEIDLGGSTTKLMFVQ